MQPLLTILIPSTPDRDEILKDKLLWSIRKQCKHVSKEVKIDYKDMLLHYISFVESGVPVEIMIGIDDKSMTIGEKRERLYNMESLGLYVWQIDSDDDIAPNAIELILEAIKQEPDCITFEEFVSIDGKEYKSNHSLKYSGWEGDGSKLLSDGFHFWRTPFFKSVIKTDIARSVPIPHVRWGEDNMYADELHKVLKTEVHIDQQLYLYQYISSPHNERYGIK